jgi:hypothetical protein
MEEVRLVKIPVFMCGNTFIPDRQILEAKALLTPEETAVILRIAKRTVYEKCKTGMLKSKTIGGSLRITSQSILEELARDDDGDKLIY